MQICILFVIAFGLVSTDLFPTVEVAHPSLKLTAVLLGQLLVVLAATVIVLQTQSHANRTVDRNELEKQFARNASLHLILWCVVCVCILAFFDWPAMITAPSNQWPPLLSRPLVLLPLLSPLVLSWAVFFDAECILEKRDESSSCKQTRGCLERWDYVLAQSRRFIVVPLVTLLIVVLWSDFMDIAWRGDSNSPQNILFRLAPILVLAVAFPALIRLTWRTKPLASSSLRHRLVGRSKTLDFPIRDILMWDTRTRMANAAVVGTVPTFRYILLSDRLIDELSELEIEMVFLHEVGHAKNLHSAKLMLGLSLVSACSSLLFVQALDLPSYPIVAIPMAFAVGLAGLGLVGQYARLLELEADLWAAQHFDDPRDYLYAIGRLASGHPDKSTWLHPSFQERCDFLLKGIETANASLRSNLRTVVFHLWTWACVFGLLSLLLNQK